MKTLPKTNKLGWLWRYRWLIALLLILLGTLLKINGSSIEMWNLYFPTSPGSDTLFGIPRSIRSDEWAVLTPMILSQYQGQNAFSVISDIIRGGGTDIAIVYGLPVKSIISILFRPFLTGFLLLGPERGLAFFWCARLILLWMVWFDLAMLMTDHKLLPSLICAFLVAFSPMIQWWFAVNGLVEMLIFGGGAVLLLDHFLKEEKRWRRLLCLPGFYVCAGGYTATLYPAQMVSLFYVFLGLAAWVVFMRRKQIGTGAVDWVAFGVTLCALAGTLLAVFLKHEETIRLVMNSDYPGIRKLNGGGGLPFYFTQWGNIFLPFDETYVPDNTCESAFMLGFFPLGFVLCGIASLKRKRVDGLSLCLTAVWLLLSAYCIKGFPSFLSKITLLEQVTTRRGMVAVGLVNILLLVRGLSLQEKELHFVPILIGSVVYGFGVALLERKLFYGIYLNPGRIIMIFCLSVLFCLGLLDWKRVSRLMTVLVCALVLIMGGTVNPLQIGCSKVPENEAAKAIAAVVEQDPTGLWAVEGAGFPMNNYPIMFGAPTVNSTSVYPDLEKWGRLDPEGQYRSVYNRYSHIQLLVRDEIGERFTLLNPDYFSVEVTAEELADELNVNYVLSGTPLDQYSTENVHFTPIAQAGQYVIWQVDSAIPAKEGNEQP